MHLAVAEQHPAPEPVRPQHRGLGPQPAVLGVGVVERLGGEGVELELGQGHRFTSTVVAVEVTLSHLAGRRQALITGGTGAPRVPARRVAGVDRLPAASRATTA